MDNDPGSYDDFRTSKLEAELRHLDAMNLSYSAEFAIKALQVTESSERTEDLESTEDIEAKQTATAAGEFVAGGAALAAAPEIEGLVDELRHTLSASEQTEEASTHLLELWTIIEPTLNERETDELRPAVLAQLFGEPDAPISLSRGGQAQGGGY